MKKRHKITKEEMELIKKGFFIEAIKSIRTRTDMWLLDARNLANAYRDKGQKSITVEERE